jgi:hypothetical protein
MSLLLLMQYVPHGKTCNPLLPLLTSADTGTPLKEKEIFIMKNNSIMLKDPRE